MVSGGRLVALMEARHSGFWFQPPVDGPVPFNAPFQQSKVVVGLLPSRAGRGPSGEPSIDRRARAGKPAREVGSGQVSFADALLQSFGEGHHCRRGSMFMADCSDAGGCPGCPMPKLGPPFWVCGRCGMNPGA